MPDAIFSPAGLVQRHPGVTEVQSTPAACGYRLLEVRDAPDQPGREFVVHCSALSASPPLSG